MHASSCTNGFVSIGLQDSETSTLNTALEERSALNLQTDILGESADYKIQMRLAFPGSPSYSVNEGLLSRKKDSILALNSYVQGTITYSHARSHYFRLDPVCSPTPYLQRIPR